MINKLIKIRIGNYRYPVTLIQETSDSPIQVKFGFNRDVIDEIKSMEGARWNPEKKYWTIKASIRNHFRLEFLTEQNPYARYDLPLVEWKSEWDDDRPYREDQKESIRQVITRHYTLLAEEMGVGKSLEIIKAMEIAQKEFDCKSFIWCSSKGALYSTELELRKWKSKVNLSTGLSLMTYEGLVKLMKNWIPGTKPPQFIIFDEAHKLKNPMSQRGQAGRFISEAVHREWGNKGFIVPMTGTAAPKDPTDWWNTCITADTWIFTTEGPKQVWQLINTKCNIIINNQTCVSENGFFETGKKQVYEVLTDKGYKFKATANHKVLCDFQGIELWQTIEQLKIGTLLKLCDNENVHWEGEGTKEEGYIVGLTIGDGNISKGNGRITFGLEANSIIIYVSGILEKYNINKEIPKNKKWQEKYIISGPSLDIILRKFGIKENKQISGDIENCSSEFLEGMVAGLIDSDGHIVMTGNQLKIEFTQTDKNRIEAIQRILGYLGISSTIYKTKLSNKLCITNVSVQRFYTRIDLKHNIKAYNLKEKVNTVKIIKSTEQFLTKVKSITQFGVEYVYDINVPNKHCFSGNGIILHNCEICQPGYLREGDIVKFKKRLAIIEQRESITGQSYPHLIGWRDSELRCSVCGKQKDDPCHKAEMEMFGSGFHQFISCKNEVALLYKRLKGLVLVKFKKDCLNLPEMQYKIIRLKPTQSILNAAEIIKARAESAIKTLTLMRELSDGFQYREEKVPGEYVQCPTCHGSMVEDYWEYIGPDEHTNDDSIYLSEEHENEFSEYTCGEYARSKVNNATLNYQDFPQWFKNERIDCKQCEGKGRIPLVRRETKFVGSPKIAALQNILEEHEEVQRCVVYAGFTGSIDNIIENVKKFGWDWIRVDGRGWLSSLSMKSLVTSDGKSLKPTELLEAFQNKNYLEEKGLNSNGIVFVGHPDSAGEGITLTASPTIVYYSNSFDGKARTQSKARIHRPGLDPNLGATIIDLFHLPSDEYVYKNLENKRKLESLSLGVMLEELTKTEQEYERQD